MPRQPRVPAESGIYHVMVRGVNRDVIFLEEEDCHRFLESVNRAKSRSGCSVLGYCLMSNHAHLLIHTRVEPIGATMKRLGVSYAYWFNRKYGRAGYVFQGRFRSEPVENDAYFATVLRYIWQNPVKAGLVESPAEYRWSSCSSERRPGLVDERDLDDLLPTGAWSQLLNHSSDLPTAESMLGAPVRQSAAAKAVRLLEQICGARSSDEFQEMERIDQRRIIRELRTRQVSYAVIAKVTGIPASTVKRLQLAS